MYKRYTDSLASFWMKCRHDNVSFTAVFMMAITVSFFSRHTHTQTHPHIVRLVSNVASVSERSCTWWTVCLQLCTLYELCISSTTSLSPIIVVVSYCCCQMACFQSADSVSVENIPGYVVCLVCSRWPNVTLFWTTSSVDCRSTLQYVFRYKFYHAVMFSLLTMLIYIDVCD